MIVVKIISATMARLTISEGNASLLTGQTDITGLFCFLQEAKNKDKFAYSSPFAHSICQTFAPRLSIAPAFSVLLLWNSAAYFRAYTPGRWHHRDATQRVFPGAG